MFAREPRYPGRRFSFKRLPIKTSFAGDDNVRSLNCRFEIDEFSDKIEARAKFAAAETHQTKAKSARRSSAWSFAKVAAEIARNHVGQSSQGTLKNLELFGRSTFLRPKRSRRAPLSEKRISHVHRHLHPRKSPI
ncbi:MAG: hypothetical protein QOK24_1833 [Verrucomicrobiota bacterium]